MPFPVQSPLSGVAREDRGGWYRRLFRLPAGWAGQHVMLNFGAVSWVAAVYVNGHLAGWHKGDYDSFSLDITRLLRPGGNELIVGFLDPVGAAREPVGKQVPGAPYGFEHTASSGIWQTVWLEPVAATHVAGLTLTPRLSGGERLEIAPAMAGSASGVAMEAAAYAGSQRVAGATGSAALPLTLKLPGARLWSPADPYLYTLHVRLLSHGRVIDQVSSYFGMREVTLGRAGGAVRILLNGQPLFQAGALDQGMWPDGLYTPPADGAMQADVLAAKSLGFNMLREHAKVQPDRWYMWADRLGLLVWQDMPSMPIHSDGARIPAARAEFRHELSALVTQLRDHPSIVTWIPFNEGWQIFDLAGVVAQIRRLDPTRLIDADSGSASCCGLPEAPQGDLRDSHIYFGPFAVAPDRRASVIGEFGGVLPLAPAGDGYPAVPTSVGSPVLAWSTRDISAIVRAQYANLAEQAREAGISGAVFTELTATEQELGLITYDRRRLLLSRSLIRHGNAQAIAAEAQAAAVAKRHRSSGGGAGSGGVAGTGAGSAAGGAGTPPAGANGGAVVPARAVAAWSFDEGTGMTAGPAPVLTLAGGTGWTRGVSGHALRISAAGEGASTAGAVLDTSRSFTVSAWVRLSAVAPWGSAVGELGEGGQVFLLGLAPTGTGLTGWSFGVATATGCGVTSCGVTANLHYGDGRFAPVPGGWHLLSGSFDARGHTIALYVDGLLDDLEHVTSVPRASGPLQVGVPPEVASGGGGQGTSGGGGQEASGGGGQSPPGAAGGAPALLGSVDELRLWARVLSPAEEWALYAATRRG